MREMTVLVDRGLDAEQLRRFLQEQGGRRLHDVAHALLVEHTDDGAQIFDVKVLDVEIDEDAPTQVEIGFETSWSVYKGCRNMNTSGLAEERERATYEPDGRLVFVVPLARKQSEPC